MSRSILESELTEAMIRERRELGLDRYDEVWDGVYLVSPFPNDEHQEIVTNLSGCLLNVVQNPRKDKVRPGVNVTDREEDWRQNFRCPDVVVFLKDTTAINKDSHWLGGPDFAVEVISRYDETREKLGFYADVKTRELLIVDRYPWAVELYRLVDGGMVLIGKSSLVDPIGLNSEVLPVGFRLIEGEDRPMIEVTHRDGVRAWIV